MFKLKLEIDAFLKTCLAKRPINAMSRNKTLCDKIHVETNYLDTAAPLSQRLYHIEHGIHPPLCIICMIGKVRWSNDKKKYHDTCSNACSYKKQQITICDQYNKVNGTSYMNMSQIPEHQEKSKKTRIKNGNQSINKSRKTSYYYQVWKITEQNYNTNINTIDPKNLRGHGHELDHMCSINYGYNNNIAPEIIASCSNLQVITAKTNNNKRDQCTITIDDLMQNISIGLIATPIYNTNVIGESKRKLTKDDVIAATTLINTGLCKYIVAHRYNVTSNLLIREQKRYGLITGHVGDDVIRDAMVKISNGEKKGVVAKNIGISRTTLYNRIRKLTEGTLK